MSSLTPCIKSPIPLTHPSSEDLLAQTHTDAVIPDLPAGDLWVFGYGSLMWRPGFDYLESMQGKVFGYHRSLCVSSWVHRGTPEKPGLVLGLDKGGSCKGVAFKVAAQDKAKVAAYLYQRELPTLVYRARFVNVHTLDGRCVNALSFVVDNTHEQYIKNKSIDELAIIVNSTCGINGKSSDYLLSTVEHLRESNIHDRHLESLARKVIS